MMDRRTAGWMWSEQWAFFDSGNNRIHSFIYMALNNLGHVLLSCRSCLQVHRHICHNCMPTGHPVVTARSQHSTRGTWDTSVPALEFPSCVFPTMLRTHSFIYLSSLAVGSVVTQAISTQILIVQKRLIQTFLLR
jgi:hypothetical protein